MTRYYAIKRLVDNKYYNYLYKDFMDLHQNTKLYKTVSNAESNFNQCLRAMFYEHRGRFNSEYTNAKDYIEDNKNDFKVVPMELREVV